MRDLYFTEEFLLCVLNDKGKVSTFDSNVPVCMVAGSIIQLMTQGCIKVENEKLYIENDLPESMHYLKSLYDFIGEKPRTMKKVTEEYCFSFSDKMMTRLMDDTGHALVNAGCAKPDKGGITGSKNRFIPEKDRVDRIIQKLRAELLEEGDVSDETILLVSLLEKSGHLKEYFSKYEKQAINVRLKQIRETDSNKLVAKLVDYINELLTIMVVIAAN